MYDNLLTEARGLYDIIFDGQYGSSILSSLLLTLDSMQSDFAQLAHLLSPPVDSSTITLLV